jgi:CMP-N-acetylneuraminic acid synthetase
VKPYVVAGIFARGGSKGVPRKNVRLLAGKPLIAHAIETARKSALIDRVFVSTDDREIAEVATQYGAEVPFMRPPELARDDSPEWMAWQHAIRTLDGTAGSPNWDAFVCVPTTSPLRKREDVDACISVLLAGDADIVITVRPAERSPYFNMVTIDDRGYARLAIQLERETFRRQDAPAMFDVTTVAYAARPSFVLSATSMFQGRVQAVVIPSERALDIDTELDFRVAEFLLQPSEPRP